MHKQISYKIVSLVFGILVLCFAITFYAVGWTEPSVAPPGGNVSAPLNVSGTGQAKAGGLVIHSSSSFEDPANPNALLIPYGNVGIGTTSPGVKLEVAGQIKITGGSPDTGKVLTTDASGLASWQFEPAVRMCNSVDTRSPVKKYRGGWPFGSGTFSYSKGYDWEGYDTISMLIDGRNICEDDNGCTYRIWAYTAAKPAGALFYTKYPVMFRQIDTHAWHDGYGDQTGVNGDGVEVKTLGWGDPDIFQIWDDKPSSTGGENSPDELTIRDNSATYAFLITICDY